MKTLFCHVSHEKTLAVSNTFPFPHNVKSFQDESLNIDHRSIIVWIITNIPIILCFQNGGGHGDVTPRCTSPVIPFWPSITIASTNYCLIWSMHKYNGSYCHLGWRINASLVGMEDTVLFKSFLLSPPVNIFLLVFELCNLYCFWICSVILYLKYPHLLLVDMINSCKDLCLWNTQSLMVFFH